MKRAASTKKSASVSSQVREYFASLPPKSRREARRIRDAIRSAAPRAVEHFSYGIPGFRLDGQPLVWYAVFKKHISLYPLGASIREAHADVLKNAEFSTGTIRFPIDDPPSTAVVKRLTKARIAQIRKANGRSS